MIDNLYLAVTEYRMNIYEFASTNMIEASTILSVQLYSNQEEVQVINMKIPFKLHFKLKHPMTSNPKCMYMDDITHLFS